MFKIKIERPLTNGKHLCEGSFFLINYYSVLEYIYMMQGNV